MIADVRSSVAEGAAVATRGGSREAAGRRSRSPRSRAAKAERARAWVRGRRARTPTRGPRRRHRTCRGSPPPRAARRRRHDGTARKRSRRAQHGSGRRAPRPPRSGRARAWRCFPRARGPEGPRLRESTAPFEGSTAAPKRLNLNPFLGSHSRFFASSCFVLDARAVPARGRASRRALHLLASPRTNLQRKRTRWTKGS